ncbi:hypothetical protein EXIGLDRAFT_720159 [Exidia glandulosa HHB12029]|uniref:Uncharacterized protein n=1 Tax=Exidia glandulosa HHB12029 TaxID=1314781 RepID=A0A165GK89_EXIGL|nr:hypothetical protein EXIGLDRAFT_720159 [Exidia glandulosa HHB12029]
MSRRNAASLLPLTAQSAATWIRESQSLEWHVAFQVAHTTLKLSGHPRHAVDALYRSLPVASISRTTGAVTAALSTR